MKRIQKIAWCIVIIIPIAVTLSAVCATILYFKLGWPRASAGLGLLGLVGLAGASPRFFKKDSEPTMPDERDQFINKNAAVAGFTAAYLIVGLTCMIPFFALGSDAKISVEWLPNIFMAAGISHFFAYSVAILIQYGKGEKEQSHE